MTFSHRYAGYSWCGLCYWISHLSLLNQDYKILYPVYILHKNFAPCHIGGTIPRGSHPYGNYIQGYHTMGYYSLRYCPQGYSSWMSLIRRDCDLFRSSALRILILQISKYICCFDVHLMVILNSFPDSILWEAWTFSWRKKKCGALWFWLFFQQDNLAISMNLIDLTQIPLTGHLFTRQHPTW